MRSLRSRLLALWLMLVASGTALGFLLFEFYRQSSDTQVGRAEDSVLRACRDLADRYRFFASGWHGGAIDGELREQLVVVAQLALMGVPGVEGGFWQENAGSLAYAFPTYEGTGPKTDVPAAELSTIQQVNQDALRNDRPTTIRQVGHSQVLVLHACPLPGPLPDLTGWTMTRAFTADTRAYNQLLAGLTILALIVFGSAVWLARVLYSFSNQLARLEASLAKRQAGDMDFPALAPTGVRELDRLVDVLNAAGTRLAQERKRASAAERLAAVGRLAAGLAHEIRNPIAAMRLRAENALAASGGDRPIGALRSILEQVGRLDALLHDLLAMTQPREPKPCEIDLAAFLHHAVEPHRELAVAKNVKLEIAPVKPVATKPQFEAERMQRALDNLILNAMQSSPSSVTVGADRCGDHLCLRVCDTGEGVPEGIRESLFEPFVTGRSDGTGLGLAVVREIARAHGGEARYVPKKPHGAIFEIEVPWRQS